MRLFLPILRTSSRSSSDALLTTARSHSSGPNVTPTYPKRGISRFSCMASGCRAQGTLVLAWVTVGILVQHSALGGGS